MQHKKKARKYIDPDDFHLARRKAGLTMQQAAIELDVDVRTIRNYEKGVCRIPYPAFRLIRLFAGYGLIGRDWHDWSFKLNKLFTPEGRSFEAHELRYIATYISIARHFLQSKTAPSVQRSPAGASKALKTIEAPTAARERPSSATALFGVKVAHEPSVELDASLACIEKAA